MSKDEILAWLAALSAIFAVGFAVVQIFRALRGAEFEGGIIGLFKMMRLSAFAFALALVLLFFSFAT